MRSGDGNGQLEYFFLELDKLNDGSGAVRHVIRPPDGVLATIPKHRG
jgi:hypothetical protein